MRTTETLWNLIVDLLLVVIFASLLAIGLVLPVRVAECFFMGVSQ